MRVRYVEVPKDANDTIVDQLLEVERFNSKDLLEAYKNFWNYTCGDFDAWSRGTYIWPENHAGDGFSLCIVCHSEHVVSCTC